MQANNKQQHASEVRSSSPAFRCSSAVHRCTFMEPSLHGWASGSDLSCILQAPIVNNSDMTTHRTGSWGREWEGRGLARAEFGVTLEHAWARQVTAIPRVCNRVPRWPCLSAVGFWRVRQVVKCCYYLRTACVVSGFWSGMNDISTLQRCYAALIGSYGRFGTIYQSSLQIYSV
jgi:hypothetical protein